MNLLSQGSCLQFAPAEKDQSHLHVLPGDSCGSHIGLTSHVQALFFGGYNCRGDVTVATHLLLHTLGLWHEHTRPDRDEYVGVSFANVKAGADDNFAK